MSANLRKYIVVGLALAFVTGCSSKKDENKRAPHTGNETTEREDQAPADQRPPSEDQQVPGKQPLGVKPLGEVYYVTATEGLNVRSTPDFSSGDNILGKLNYKDSVLVLAQGDSNGMAPIEVVSTTARINTSDKYYASTRYLSRTVPADSIAVSRKFRMDASFNYFVVQNIATERMRVYERKCEGEDLNTCEHRMVLETEIAVGEQKEDRPNLMTISGYFHIKQWVKFYQDGGGLYPSWYDPDLRMPPGPYAELTDWRNAYYMPKGGSVRGAFGWYTALIGPDADYQWTHGTIGWGKNKKDFIKVTRTWYANLLSDPRSHGCSRTDNESIAYLRSLLPVGTPLIKIYAREAYANPSLPGYSKDKAEWEYILTKNGVRSSSGELADRQVVLANGTPKDDWIEEGTYEVDAYPEARPFKGGSKGAKSGKNGNIYGLEADDMHGYFLVDTGQVVDYKKPKEIKRGGESNILVPDYMISDTKNFVVPQK